MESFDLKSLCANCIGHNVANVSTKSLLAANLKQKYTHQLNTLVQEIYGAGAFMKQIDFSIDTAGVTLCINGNFTLLSQALTVKLELICYCMINLYRLNNMKVVKIPTELTQQRKWLMRALCNRVLVDSPSSTIHCTVRVNKKPKVYVVDAIGSVLQTLTGSCNGCEYADIPDRESLLPQIVIA